MIHKMPYLRFLPFLILLLVLGHFANGQSEFFHELVLEKKLMENEKWELIGETNWKYLYNEPSWRRWGLSFAGVRKIKRFSIMGGTDGYYTFNNKAVDFFEVRPWTSVQHKLPLVSEWFLRQMLKLEWRFFKTESQSFSNENYSRLRYQIGLDIPLFSKKDSEWKVRPYFEWFFIRNPATYERFSNERDYGLMATKSFKNQHELSFNYKVEEFYTQHSEKEYGHLFLLAYSF